MIINVECETDEALWKMYHRWRHAPRKRALPESAVILGFCADMTLLARAYRLEGQIEKARQAEKLVDWAWSKLPAHNRW